MRVAGAGSFVAMSGDHRHMTLHRSDKGRDEAAGRRTADAEGNGL
jgi:hypothetical protein